MSWNKTNFYIWIVSILLISCNVDPNVTWDREKLAEAKEYSQNIGTFAFILSTNNKIVAAWGDTITPTELHSARKSISSSIYAIYSEKGLLDTEKTLEEIGIDDSPNPLNDLQKQAKVIHLIKSSSGINHAAAAETDGMRKEKDQILGKEPNTPGEKWAYNNWDYNTLITIFQKETGISEKDAFHKNLALPLQMKDITDSTALYHNEPGLSIHSSIAYYLSARDMLKFGQLCLNKGNWNGKQIVPESYFEKITNDYSVTGGRGLRSGHGFMWWVPFDKIAKEMGIPKGTYIADGLGNQQIVVIPEWETVLVHKTKTNLSEGFLMWLEQEGFTKSDSIHIVNNLQTYLNDFLNFLVNDCRDSSNSNNPICQNCTWLGEADYLKLLEMILRSKK